jgi:dynein heavy chain
MESTNGLKTVKLTESNFMHILENGIKTGTPVLLEDVGETLDSALGPVLLKQTFFQVCQFKHQNLLNK